MLGIHLSRVTPSIFRRKMVAVTCLLTFIFISSISSIAFAAEIFTQEPQYSPTETAVIEGNTFWANETVTLQVTETDGTPLSGDGGLPWNEIASPEGSFITYWDVDWAYAGITLLVTAEGLSSGETATAAFLAPSTSHNQLQNDETPEWANGNMNSSNTCYSEGRSVPHRFFAINMVGGTKHTLNLSMEWTKGGKHAYDYVTDYDASETGSIVDVGGVCSDISTDTPGDADSCLIGHTDCCRTPEVSYPLPDFLNLANYAGTIPSDFFTTVNPSFVLDGPRNIYAYNVIIDSIGKYSFSGDVVETDRTFDFTIYFTIAGDTTGSIGFFWGGHLAEGNDDTWGYGNGSASVSGAPYHMNANFDGGNGPDRSIQTGGICLAPNTGIVSDSATVCDYGSFTYVARDTASTANAWTWTITNGTIVGSHELDSVVFTVDAGLLPDDTVYVSVESCDSASGCPGDYCCASDTYAFPVISCNNPPIAICQDVTVYADANCQANASVDNGSYDPDGDPVTIVETPPGPYTVGATLVTLIITDDKGAADTCQGTVTVIDNTPPVPQCPDDIVVDNDAGVCGAVVNFTATVTDNCPGPTISCSPASGSLFPIGTTTVTCTATDASNNTSTCSFTVTVNDTEDPVAQCPANITVGNDAGLCGATVNFTATVTDNCPGATISCSPASGTFFPVGTTTVTCTATDASNNTATCTFTVTVNDTEDPVANCPANISVNNDPGECGAIVTFNATATDNCPGVMISCTPPSGSFFPVGVTTVTCTATDASNNTSTCTFTVTVIDNEDPVVQCPANITTSNDEGECGAIVTFAATVTDNCPGATVSCVPPSGSFFDVGTTVVTCTATDASNNTATCTFEITVEDDELPQANCPEDMVLNNDPGECGAIVDFTATVTDNCPGATIGCNPPSGSFFPVGITYVSCFAHDAAGNKVGNNCVFTITVVDNEPPVPDCPDDITVVTEAGECGATVTFTADVTDNCPGATISCNPPSGTFFPVGTTVVTCTATDAADNTAECTFNVTVTNSPPVASCPGNQSFSFACEPEEICIGPFSATDADNNLVDESVNMGTLSGGNVCFTPTGPGVYTIIFTATDACDATDQCQVNVTVTFDNQPPVANCPDNQTLDVCDLSAITIDGFSCSDPDDNLATCTVDNGTLTGSAVTFTPIAGLNTITLTATDDCGLTASCQTEITVNLNSPPEVSCPDNQTIDVCSLADITIPGFGCSDPDGNLTDCSVDLGTLTDGSVTFTPVEGVNTITLTATDACQETASCQTEITVNLNQPPEVTCPDNQTLEVCTLDPITIGGFGCTDANLVSCDVDNGTLIGDEVTFTPVAGANTITLTAIDACQETASCQTVITVNLNQPPEVTCPDNQTLDVCSLAPITIGGFSCSDANLVSCDVDNGTLSGDEVTFTPVEGLNVITLTAVDACQATASCQTEITVNLNRLPEANCPDNQTLDVCDLSPITVSGFSCSDPDDDFIDCSVDKGTLTAGSVTFTPVAGANVITLTATDGCGSTSCQTTITVNLNNPPVATCPGNQTMHVCELSPITVDGFSCSDVDGNLATCTVDKGTLSSGSVTFTPVEGDNIITLTATDDCQATDNCQTTITVTVDDPPIATCPGDTTIIMVDNVSMICLAGFGCSDPNGNLATCEISGVDGYLDGDEVCFTPVVGINTITLTATDDCGNIATCETVVTIELTTDCPIIKIEKTHGTLQGHFVDVHITTENSMKPMGGFELLIAYDASALTFMEATPGQLLEDCDWEYFSYRFGVEGNCGDACPSGLLRIIAIAETFDGDNHPLCFGPPDLDPHELAVLTFLVTNDRSFEGQYIPIQFFWVDCNDNTFSDRYGDILYIDEIIYTFQGNVIWDESDNTNYPEASRPPFTGAVDACMAGYKEYPVRCLEFWNGGVDIIPSDEIDDRGDINMNGIPYEIADAVMFTKFFIDGLDAFGAHPEASIAASEVNADGVVLTVADLVYMIRVITGDALPYPKPLPGAAAEITTMVSAGEITVQTIADIPIGAILLIYNIEGVIGEPVIGQGAAGMDIEYSFDGNQLRLLIYNIGTESVAAGKNILATIPIDGAAQLADVEIADYNGSPIQTTTRLVPSDYDLSQNYPNPFNPTTTLILSLPQESDWTIAIYNIAGQLINEYHGHSAAGDVRVDWDGTDANGNTVASGIYLYKAKAGIFTATRKMVLMK